MQILVRAIRMNLTASESWITFMRLLYDVYKEYKKYILAQREPLTYKLVHSKSFDHMPAHLMKAFTGNYVDKSVIKTVPEQFYSIQFTIDNTHVQLYIVNTPSMISLQKCVNVIGMFIFFLNRLCTQRQEVVLMMMTNDKPKRLPSTNIEGKTPLGPSHVNSGFTTFLDNYCFVFRKEEMLKVALHELMHLYGMDYRKNDSNDTNIVQIQKQFNIQGDVHYGASEAYNELMTSLVMICFVVMRKPHTTFTSFAKEYRTQLKHRVKYMIGVAARILQYYGYTAYVDRKPIIQSSHIHAYYIGKLSLIYTFDQLIRNLKFRLPLDSAERIAIFQQALYQSLQNPEFIEALDKKLLEMQNKKVKKTTHTTLSSLAMLNIEL
jgi:hypothetical protein